MSFHKLVRLCCSLAIMALLAVSCSADTAIDTETTAAGASNGSSDTTDPSAVPPTAEAEPTAVPPTAEAEPTAVETEDTTDEDQDTTSSSDDDDVVIENRDDAIAFIISEGFVARDAECIAEGAYQVFGTWDFVDLDTDADQDADLEVILDTCITVVPGPAAGSPPPGTDAELDVLWVACDDGSAEACDDLYWDAPIDSDYEAFGLTCGGRAIDDCSDLLGGPSGGNTRDDADSPAAGSPPPGTDAELDALWLACDGGSAEACEDLFWRAPVDSDYEAFGLSCGGRGDGSCADLLGDDSGGSASGEVPGPAAGSPSPGTDAELDALWVACDGGSAEACDDLFWQAPVDSDYEAFGLSCGGRAIDICSEILDG